MRRTQTIVVELLPAAEPYREGQWITDDRFPPEVLAVVTEAHDPVKEP